MRKLNASVPALFTTDEFFVNNIPDVDMNDVIWVANGAEVVNEFESFRDKCAIDKSECLISLPDKSPSFSRRKCHFKF